jgi:hypothetical protein
MNRFFVDVRVSAPREFERQAVMGPTEVPLVPLNGRGLQVLRGF